MWISLDMGDEIWDQNHVINLGSLKIFIQHIKYDIKYVKHIYNLLKSKSECIYGPFSIKFFFRVSHLYIAFFSPSVENPKGFSS